MDITKLPKDMRKKYEEKVLKKAIEKTEYDLAKNNKSSDDISEKKYVNVRDKYEEIKLEKIPFVKKNYKKGD